MPLDTYQFTQIPVYNLSAPVGMDFIRQWKVIRDGAAFPFFDDSDNLLWSGKLEIFDGCSDVPLYTYTTDDSFFINSGTEDSEPVVHFGFTIPNATIGAMPKQSMDYKITFTRLEDSYELVMLTGRFITV